MPSYFSNKSIFLLSSVLLLIVLSAVSCNQAPEEPVVVTMITGAVGKEYEVLQEQVTQFESEHPTIDVQIIDLPESTTDRYQATTERLREEDGTIDIFMIDIIWPPEFGANGWTVPLDDYVAESDINLDDFVPSILRGNTWDGKLVSMPWFTDAGILYYRTDLLTEYGFETPPETWAELQAMSEAIVAAEQAENDGMVGFVYQADLYEGLVTNYLEYVWSNGADVLNETSDEVVLDSPEAVEALEIYIAMQAIAPTGITRYKEEDALNYFGSGSAVFMRNWPYAWAVLNDDNSPIKGKVGIATIPRGPQGEAGASTLGGWQLGINAYSENPDESFELIAFLTNPEQQNYKAIHAGQLPTRQSSYENEAVLNANPHLRDLSDVVLNSNPRPVHPDYQDMSVVIQEEVYKALTGEQSAAIATTNIAVAIESILNAN